MFLVRWPCDDREVAYGFYPYLGAYKIVQWPHGVLTAAVRQTCGSCNNHEGAVRSPYGRLPVSLRSLCGFFYLMNVTEVARPVAAIKSLRFALLKTQKFEILMEILYAPQKLVVFLLEYERAPRMSSDIETGY